MSHEGWENLLTFLSAYYGHYKVTDLVPWGMAPATSQKDTTCKMWRSGSKSTHSSLKQKLHAFPVSAHFFNPYLFLKQRWSAFSRLLVWEHQRNIQTNDDVSLLLTFQVWMTEQRRGGGVESIAGNAQPGKNELTSQCGGWVGFCRVSQPQTSSLSVAVLHLSRLRCSRPIFLMLTQLGRKDGPSSLSTGGSDCVFNDGSMFWLQEYALFELGGQS